MILIKTIYKLSLIFLSFLTYNLESIDSNSDKILLYDNVNIYDENNFKIYFKNSINSYEIDNVINKLDIEILSYIIDGNNYYAKDNVDLIKKYTIDKSLEEKIYYELKGINIEGINVKCENKEIIKLSNIEKIY